MNRPRGVIWAWRINLLAGAVVLAAAFFIVQRASAQETTQEPAVATSVADSASTDVAATSPVFTETQPTAPAETVSAEATADEAVTAADLGVTSPTILPDSALYSFKRFGRSLRKALVFNPQKKANLELRYANQELFDARRLIDEKAGDPAAFATAADSIRRFGIGLERAKERQDRVEPNGAAAQEVLENVLDKQFKQQKVLDQLHKRVLKGAPENVAASVAEAIEDTQEQVATHVAEAFTRSGQDQNQLAAMLGMALDAQPGSEFKHLRNLEVLKRLEDRVPEEARAAIRRAEDNALKRFAGQFEQLPEGDRGGRFERYVEQVGGDETRHLEVFDRMKALTDISPEMAQRLELAKDVAAKRFQEKIEDYDQEFKDEATRERLRERAFARFDQVKPQDLEKLRLLDDIRQRVEFDSEKITQEIEKKQEAAVEQFKSSFPDDDSQNQAEEFRALSKKMAENPDPATFRLIHALEEKVKSDPKKRAFLEQMEQETKAKFVDEAQKRGAAFFEQIASSNPQDIEVYQRLKEDFQKNPEGFIAPPFGEDGFMPPAADTQRFMGQGIEPGFFDQAIQTHTEVLSKHVQSIQDPQLFENFQKKFRQGPADIASAIQAHDSQFKTLFEQKRRLIEEQSFASPNFMPGQFQDEERRNEEDGFRVRLEAAQTPEEQAQVIEDRRSREQEFSGRSLETQKQMFQKRLEFDPFCDDTCRAGEVKKFEKMQQQRHPPEMPGRPEGVKMPGGPEEQRFFEEEMRKKDAAEFEAHRQRQLNERSVGLPQEKQGENSRREELPPAFMGEGRGGTDDRGINTRTGPSDMNNIKTLGPRDIGVRDGETGPMPPKEQPMMGSGEGNGRGFEHSSQGVPPTGGAFTQDRSGGFGPTVGSQGGERFDHPGSGPQSGSDRGPAGPGPGPNGGDTQLPR